MTNSTIEELMSMKVDTSFVKNSIHALSGCNYKKDIAKIKEQISEDKSRISEDEFRTSVLVLDELVNADPAILSKLCKFTKEIVSDKLGEVPVVGFAHRYEKLDKLYSFCIVSKLYETANIFMLAMQIIDTNRQYEKLIITAKRMGLVAVEKEVDEW